MKKALVTIIIILVVAGAITNWTKVKSWLTKKAPKVAEIIQNNQAVESVKQQVQTGGALRGSQNAPDAFLTRVGTINLTNAARKANGNLPALKENSKLDQAAQNKLRDMFTQQYFEHVNPQGLGPADQAKAVGYEFVMIGENLALGNFKNDQALVDAWMASPGHRANILNNGYQEIGVAVGQGMYEGHMEWLAVQEFGKPLSSCPAIDSNLKAQIDSLKQDVDQITPEMQQLKSEIDNTPDPQTKQEADAYNEKINEYNALVKIYNNKVDQLKTTVTEYNIQVQAFNACAS